jgi:RNA polymerase sigma-70 factor, ECF subfamily
LAILGIDLDDTLERARRMDANALAQIHDRFYPEVYRYVRFRLQREQICEDITAEVFLRLLDALNRRHGPDHNLRGWLFATASNLVNDHLRRRYSRPVENLDEQENHPDHMPHPESSVEQMWEQEKVRQAIEKLTPEQQHVLALRFTEDRSLDETAKIVGKSVNAVKALQFRALGSLRRLLSDEGKE